MCSQFHDDLETLIKKQEYVQLHKFDEKSAYAYFCLCVYLRVGAFLCLLKGLTLMVFFTLNG